MLAKRTELFHAENARAPIIGIIEKREGQEKKGTTANGSPFYATENHGIARFPNSGSNKGLFRVTTAGTQDAATLTLLVWDEVSVHEQFQVTADTPLFPLTIKEVEYIVVSEPSFYTVLDNGVIMLDGTSNGASIYALSTADVWTALADTDAANIIGGQFSFTNARGSLVAVNGRDYNRLLSSNGTTVLKSTDAGSLFNSPRARKTSFYKNRIYLADYTYSGVRYKTSVIRSSYPNGIVALVNGDHTSLASGGTLSLTDTKYLYTDTGMNSYDIYRGTTKISTVTVTAIQETSVTITFSGPTTFLSSDEFWIAGTYSGEKQFRWVNNPTSFGRDVKQYDTFQLAGGDEEEINMLEPVGNVLMIASKSTMMSWNDFTLENFDLGVGCSSPNGYTKLLGKIYFIHSSGIYYTGGAIPTLVSRKVQKYISGATKSGLENAAAGVKGLSVFFSIGDVTLYNADGSFWKTLPDVCLEYATGDQNWYVHTNVPAKEFRNFIDTDGSENLLMEHTGTGKSVKKFLSGNTDDGEEIFFRADLQTVQFLKEFETNVSPIAVVTETERGSSLKCFVSLDDAAYYEMQGTAAKGVTVLKVTPESDDKVAPAICRKLRLSYRDSSKQRCRIAQSSIIFLPTAIDKSV